MELLMHSLEGMAQPPGWCASICACRGCDDCLQQPDGRWAWTWVPVDCRTTDPDGGPETDVEAGRDDGRDGDGTGDADARPDDEGIREDARDGVETGPFCGDGVRQSTEECDDGNDVAGDGCEPLTCLFSCHEPADCDDGNPCTEDRCRAVALGQRCASLARIGEGCDDGDPCTTGERCDEAGGCTGGVSVCCATTADCAAEENGDPCDGTLFCNVVTGDCEVDPATILPVGASCDDGRFCTAPDRCEGDDPATRRCRREETPCPWCAHCDESTDTCLPGGYSSSCWIDGVCYDYEQTDPAEPCR
jgi:cysteine-rich repeat protein